jgi:transposase
MIIYKATFPNGKVYIGKTKNFNHRKRCHIYCARSGKNENIIFYRAIRKYGEDNIKWEIISECSSIEELNTLEIFYIKEHNSIDYNFGYNMVCGDKQTYEIRNNFDKEYLLEIIKSKLKSNGHNPENYIPFTEELENEIIKKYVDEKYSIRKIVKEYKISKNRITRLLKSKNIEIDLERCKLTNSIQLSEEQINRIADKYKKGNTIKLIAEEEKLTIMIVSRILNDLELRISKRFKNGKRYDGKQPKRN